VKETFVQGGASFTASSRGAMVTNFIVKGTDIIYRERRVGGRSRGGIFFCAPVFGEAPPDIFPGMRKHGPLRDQEFQIADVRKDGIIYFWTNEQTKDFPWKLEHHVAMYLYSDHGLTMKLVTTRLPDGVGGAMPYNAALHPYISALGRYALVMGDEEITEFPSVSRKIPLREDAIIRQGPANSIHFALDGFDKRSCCNLWSDNPYEYLCYEHALRYPHMLGTPDGKFLREGEKSMIAVTLKTRV